MVPCPLFRGKLVSRITCSKCQAVSDTPDDFEGLSIEIQGCDRVTAALTKFGEKATLDGDNQYFCKTCRAKRCVSKRMLFTELPECLCLQLKRFTYSLPPDQGRAATVTPGHGWQLSAEPAWGGPGQSSAFGGGRKAEHHVAFAKTLDMRGFCVDELQESATAKDTQYTLTGVVCHHGSTPNSGHYTACVRAMKPPGTETWYRIDDKHVSEISLGEVQRQQDAYMLFYTRGGGSTADYTEPVFDRSEPQMQSLAAGRWDRRWPRQGGSSVARCRGQGPKPRQGSVRNGVDSLLVNATNHVRVISPTPLQDCNAAFLFLLQQR